MTKALKKPSAAERFDALLGLTLALEQQGFWLHDNECYEKGGECETALKRLAKAWKGLLEQSNEVLGIDAEFTRRGVEALLHKFATKVAEVERGDEDGYPFVWQ